MSKNGFRKFTFRCLPVAAGILLWTTAFPGISATASDEPDNDSPPSGEESRSVPELQDGADSPKTALEAFVRASRAADGEAVLLMVDPLIRPLLIPDMELERLVMDEVTYEDGFYGTDQARMPGMLFFYTDRALVRTESIRVLEERRIDDERVDFTVLTTQRSYHDDSMMRIKTHYLSVRRGDRWYVFRAFGNVLLRLRNDGIFGPCGAIESVRIDDASEGAAEIEWKFQYHIPIEIVHEHLVRTSRHPLIAECQQIAAEARRHFKRVVNRTRRGDLQTRTAFRLAVGDTLEDSFKGILERETEAFSETITSLNKIRQEQLSDTAREPSN